MSIEVREFVTQRFETLRRSIVGITRERLEAIKAQQTSVPEMRNGEWIISMKEKVCEELTALEGELIEVLTPELQTKKAELWMQQVKAFFRKEGFSTVEDLVKAQKKLLASEHEKVAQLRDLQAEITAKENDWKAEKFSMNMMLESDKGHIDELVTKLREKESALESLRAQSERSDSVTPVETIVEPNNTGRLNYLANLKFLPPLEKFSGEDDQISWKDHLALFLERYPACYWEQDYRRTFLRGTLKGLAAETYDALGVRAPWQAHLDNFNKLFDTRAAADALIAINQLNDLKLVGYDVSSFCVKMERLYKKVHPNKTYEESSFDLATRLYEQLRGWSCVASFEDIFATKPRNEMYATLRFQAINRAVQENNRREYGVRNSRTQERAQWVEKVKSFEKPKAKADQKGVKCYACHEFGHYSRSCPKGRVESNAISGARDSVIAQAKHYTARLPIVQAHIEDELVECLIDSGSQVSAIPFSLMRKLEKKGVRWEKGEHQVPHLWSADGSDIKCVGKAELRVSLAQDKTESRIPFLVLAANRESIILGCNSFDILNISLYIGQNERECFCRETREQDCEVLTAVVGKRGEEKAIPDRSEAIETPYLSAGDKIELDKLLEDHSTIFQRQQAKLEVMRVNPATITVEETKPIAQKVRPVPLAVRDELRGALEKMITDGIIEKSKSPWVSPVVLVKKKDGTMRICVDYRKVNEVIKLDKYPLPSMEVLLHRLNGCKVFSSFDCEQGFWQIPLDKKAREISAFCTHIGQFQFKRLPFGLANSPSIFQRSIEEVLSKTPGFNISIFAYLDDIIVATKDVQSHQDALRQLFSVLEQHRVTVKKSKCFFFRTEIVFLGHVVSGEGVKTDESKTEAIRRYPKPKNLKELRTFLGMLSYYRKFIPQFSTISRPLHDLTKKDAKWLWSEERQVAFAELKEKLIRAPVLSQPCLESARTGARPFIIFTDASRKGTGSVLCQESVDGKIHPIAFHSKSLSETEQRYGITDLEALAVVHACERFHYFIFGTKVIVRTDHKPLLAITNITNTSDRMLRWVIRLRTYDIKFEYIKGSTNFVADALSRGPMVFGERVVDSVDINDDVVVANVRIAGWLDILREEAPFNEIIGKLESGDDREGLIKIGSYKWPLTAFTIDGSSLRLTNEDGNVVTCVPRSAREELIANTHAGKFLAHIGQERLLGKLRNSYYWPSMAVDVKKWLKKCVTCFVDNYSNTRLPPLDPILTCKPFEIVGMDLVELPVSKEGFKYALVIVDYFSKWLDMFALKDKEASSIYKVIFEQYISRGCKYPHSIISDNGSEFDNKIFKTLAETLGIRWSPSKPYNPRQNGLAERTHKTIVSMLRKSECARSEWPARLHWIVHVYNTSVHTTTGYAPFEILYGFKTRALGDCIDFGKMEVQAVRYEDYVLETKEMLKEMHKVVRNRIESKGTKAKDQYDKRHNSEKFHKFMEGERVFLKTLVDNVDSKLTFPVRGPGVVMNTSGKSARVVIGDLVTDVQHDRLIPIPQEGLLEPNNISGGVVRKKGRPRMW